MTAARAALSLRASSARSWKLMVVSPMWKDRAWAGPAATARGVCWWLRRNLRQRCSRGAGSAAAAAAAVLTLCCGPDAQRPPGCMLPAYGTASEGAAHAGCRKRCTRHRVAAAGLCWVPLRCKRIDVSAELCTARWIADWAPAIPASKWWLMQLACWLHRLLALQVSFQR